LLIGRRGVILAVVVASVRRAATSAAVAVASARRAAILVVAVALVPRGETWATVPRPGGISTVMPVVLPTQSMAP